jgi:hypothetical protein
MSSKKYRYYCLDRFGLLHSAEWFEAESDQQAIAMISQKHPDDTCEIWRDKRLVATIAPERLSA